MVTRPVGRSRKCPLESGGQAQADKENVQVAPADCEEAMSAKSTQ